MSKWKTIDAMRPSTAPIGPGVYAFLINGFVVYVGQSQRLRERLYTHNLRHGYSKDVITPWGDIPYGVNITLKIKESRVLGDWAMWEIRLIHRLQPIYNKTHLKLRRAA